MKGLIIVGSARVNSHTNALAKYLQQLFDNHQVECEIFDLAEKPLHQLDFSGTTQAANTIKENAKVLQEKLWQQIYDSRHTNVSWFLFWYFKKRVRFLEYGSLQNEANWINRQ